MPRYIDADALENEVNTFCREFIVSYRDFRTKCALYDAMKGVLVRIYDAPTLSPDEVRGVGEITGDDACPSCGCWIPTDDAHDAIFKNEVKFCYYCGMRLRMKGAEDGTTDNS